MIVNKKFDVKVPVRIIRGYHEGRTGFIICENWDKKTDSSTYDVKLENDETHTFFAFQLHQEREFPNKEYLTEMTKREKDYKNIGAISTVFTEADIHFDEILMESVKSGTIKTVTHKDVTSKHFVDWFIKIMKIDYFADIDPKEYPFSMITHNDEMDVYVFGYFNDNRLDAIIKIEDCVDCYELSFFFVNKDCQCQGIGQYLFRFILNKFRDKKLILRVYTDNNPAIHIYKKYGFRIVKAGYGEGYRPEALHYIMQKDENYV